MLLISRSHSRSQRRRLAVTGAYFGKELVFERDSTKGFSRGWPRAVPWKRNWLQIIKRYGHPSKPLRIQFRSQSLSNPSIFPVPSRTGVSPVSGRVPGSGVRDPGDKSRATPFKSREAYVKCTRDNRLSARVCLTFLSGSRCLRETRRGCPRMFT